MRAGGRFAARGLLFFPSFRSVEENFPADVTFPASGASIKRTIIDTREEERP